MDVETLTNHISGLGKTYFENACKLVLNNVFNLRVINVDGKNDGGTDYTAFDTSAQRIDACYQITTQKTDLKNKAYKDAEKSIKKLGTNRFFFLASYNIDETDTRKIENEISKNLGISCTCLSSRNIAAFLLSENLLNRFIEDSNYPLPRTSPRPLDFKEMAIHSYTLLSDDANKLKSGIYDDTIAFILSNNKSMLEDDLITEITSFLGIDQNKIEVIKKRIGALFGKEVIVKIDGRIELTIDSQNDLKNRKRLYEIELESLSSAQVDLLRDDFSIDWNKDDSKKVALWIANAFISEQISNLKDAKASIVSNPLFNLEENGINKIKQFFIKTKKVELIKVDEIIEKLLENASDHPLISKLSRASIYLALEGSNPISSAKALGAHRWSDFNILIEPTVAIPYICSILYNTPINRYFDISIKAVLQAIELDSKLYIPYFYINECAGHLLKARRYVDIDFNVDELAYSTNAFVANYYALKSQGQRVPPTLLEYLGSFSSAIKTERGDVKSWIRAIMTDIQSILSRGGVEFTDVPFYNDGECTDFEKEYTDYLNEFVIRKKINLIKHDTYALQFTNDEILNQSKHWIILTYDKSLISISKGNLYKGWITNPVKFLDLTGTTKPLSESKLVGLVHSVATFSEKTLSVGARIIDRVVKFASKEMQNWEFKQEIEKFKQEMIRNIDIQSFDNSMEIDKKTDEFLEKLGLKQNETDDEIDVDL